MSLPLTSVLGRVTKLIGPVRGFVLLQSLSLSLFQYSEPYSDKRTSAYNILWVLVFGFATLNILGLVARRFEPRRSNMNFGEILAITVVVVSIILLSWELLYLFHIFPIKLAPR